MKRKRLWRSVLLVLLVLLLVYAGSYIVLSAAGRYEPGAIGLGHVKTYNWAPLGFVVGYVWKGAPMIIYAPLYFLDTQLWHTNDKLGSGRYPVNWVEGKDVWKIYKAHGFFDTPSYKDEAEQPR